MNISYNWLKDLIDHELEPAELGRRLTGVGLAVEGIEDRRDDHILDIDLTSNRPDCLSHIGVAREVAAITGAKLNAPKAATDVPLPAALVGNSVVIEAPELCHRFTARIIKGVRIGPSPAWLVERLEAIGERSINNVADITNFVMHELGQPMHAFDLDRLEGGRIVVRRAAEGEAITTLDEAGRSLDPSMLVICDAEKPAAVAGIMGGLYSSITEDTVNVLLEVAYFDRSSIRSTSRKLKLASEASYRFERGVDIANLIPASDRAAALICDLAGGTMGDLVDLFPTAHERISVISNGIAAAVSRLTGLDVSTRECERILDSLGIEKVSGHGMPSEFVVPTWRHDLSIEEDLVEEIARHVGFDKIASTLPPSLHAGEYQPTEPREKTLRQSLTSLGFHEALSYSFIDTSFDEVFETVPGIFAEHSESTPIELMDSVIEGAVRMRPTVLTGLLDAVRLNLNHKRRNIRLFEIGRCFGPSIDATGLPVEQKTLGLVITGGEVFADRALPVRDVDIFDIKGALEAALFASGVEDVSFNAVEVRHLRTGQSAAVLAGGDVIGYFGRVSEQIAARYKFKQGVYCAEINLTKALANEAPRPTYSPLPKYPSVVRDVTFAVDRSMTFGQIAAAAAAADLPIEHDLSFVDLYEAKGDADARALTVRIEYRSGDRTLTEAEVEEAHAVVLAILKDSTGVTPRT